MVAEIQDGIFNGNYQSYYKNGQTCAKGQFKDNFRIGEWSVWNEEGQLRVKRLYTAPFVYTTLYPTPPNSPLIELLNVPPYTPTRNAEGLLSYHFVAKNMVYSSKRLTRFLPYNNQNVEWMDMLLEYLATQDSLPSYRTAAAKQEWDTLPIMPNGQVFGFKVKEVSFFDKDRFLTESRILGLCPLLLDTVSQDTVELYWLYYPAFRESLASIPLKDHAYPAPLQNLEDIFFFRLFTSFICQEARSFRKPSPTPTLSKAALEESSYRIEVEQLEQEHKFWVVFSREENK